jgi:hypothetical protein
MIGKSCDLTDNDSLSLNGPTIVPSCHSLKIMLNLFTLTKKISRLEIGLVNMDRNTTSLIDNQTYFTQDNKYVDRTQNTTTMTSKLQFGRQCY